MKKAAPSFVTGISSGITAPSDTAPGRELRFGPRRSLAPRPTGPRGRRTASLSNPLNTCIIKGVPLAGADPPSRHHKRQQISRGSLQRRGRDAHQHQPGSTRRAGHTSWTCLYCCGVVYRTHVTTGLAAEVASRFFEDRSDGGSWSKLRLAGVEPLVVDLPLRGDTTLGTMTLGMRGASSTPTYLPVPTTAAAERRIHQPTDSGGLS